MAGHPVYIDISFAFQSFIFHLSSLTRSHGHPIVLRTNSISVEGSDMQLGKPGVDVVTALGTMSDPVESLPVRDEYPHTNNMVSTSQ